MPSHGIYDFERFHRTSDCIYVVSNDESSGYNV